MKSLKKLNPARLKFRKQLTIKYFAIVIPLFIILTVVSYALKYYGISVDVYIAPSVSNIILGAISLFTSYLIVCLLFNSYFTPLEEISEASKKIASGDYSIQIDYKSPAKELNDTIQNFNFMVQELNSVEIMRNDFVANVSHEFKTPLASISGYVTLLQDPELTEEERDEYVRLVFFNIDKLNDLTSNILQLSKLENQRALPAPVTYRLDEQVREAIVLLEPKWSQNEIYLDIDLQEVEYTGQKALLFQVWTNLIGNAIKFSHTGGKISITLENKNGKIKIIVSDEGIGMSKEAVSRVFEKFYQGDTSRQSQGNGLGLALCKKILDACHGEITVSSELGKGSTFTVTLPYNF